jgi:hypothetical protein
METNPNTGHWLKITERSDSGVICSFTDGYGVSQQLNLSVTEKSICTCAAPARPCLHIRLAQKWLETQSYLSNVSAVTEAPDIQKQQRQADRVAKLELAMQDLQLWVEDQFSRGLATQIQEQEQFAESISTRMADASLGSLHRRLTQLQEKTLLQLRSNQPIPREWADLLFLLQAGKSQNKLPDALWIELGQTLGISIRKEDVKVQGHKIKDRFTAAAIQLTQLDARLKERTTWLYAQKTGRFHAFIEHEVVGITHLPAAPRVGFTFEAEAWIYPSAAEVRILLDEIPEKGQAAGMPIPGAENLKVAYATFTEAVKRVPWLPNLAVLVAATRVFHDPTTKKWLISDSEGYQMPLLNSDPQERAQLVANCLTGPQAVFGLISAEGVFLMVNDFKYFS